MQPRSWSRNPLEGDEAWKTVCWFGLFFKHCFPALAVTETRPLLSTWALSGSSSSLLVLPPAVSVPSSVRTSVSRGPCCWLSSCCSHLPTCEGVDPRLPLRPRSCLSNRGLHGAALWPPRSSIRTLWTLSTPELLHTTWSPFLLMTC